MSSLQGKVALVTGASKGIGEAIARELAARGAAVAVNYSSNRAAAEKVVAEIKSGGVDAIAVQGDVADATSAQTLVDTVADQLGPIDILVNNAGVYEFLPLDGVSPEHFHKQFDINVLGLLLPHQSRSGSLQSRWRQHHQYRLTRRQNVSCERFGVQRYQGRSRLHHNLAFQGARAKEDSRQRDQPGLVDTQTLRTVGITDSEFHKIHAEKPHSAKESVSHKTSPLRQPS